jgi:hypothetical protein
VDRYRELTTGLASKFREETATEGVEDLQRYFLAVEVHRSHSVAGSLLGLISLQTGAH